MIGTTVRAYLDPQSTAQRYLRPRALISYEKTKVFASLEIQIVGKTKIFETQNMFLQVFVTYLNNLLFLKTRLFSQNGLQR